MAYLMLAELGVKRAASKELEIESILLGARPTRPELAALPTPANWGKGDLIAVERDVSEKRDVTPSPSHFLIRLVVSLLVGAALAGLVVLSRNVAAQRAFDAIAFNDVLSVLKALDRLDQDSILDLTIRGPGSVPGLPGASVSEGSTVQVRRWRRGTTYVRGAHEEGSLTYRFHDGTLYASEE